MPNNTNLKVNWRSRVDATRLNVDFDSLSKKNLLTEKLDQFMNSLTQMNVGQLFSKVILVIAQKMWKV